MNSLARRIIALRPTGPHRNLQPHVFRGQLRHVHKTTAEKKPFVFRWEVRIPPSTPVH